VFQSIQSFAIAARSSFFGVRLLLVPLTIFVFGARAANPAGVGPQAAEEAAHRFSTADGLEVSLFASEPMVRNPTDMDVDDRGRVWVTEGVNYRSSFQSWGTLDAGGDRIVILEDTDGDGRADKKTVFYQDPSINAALGVCVLGNKVIVSDSPNVFVLTDTNGDGVADKRELLFTGIAGKDHDHGVHAFVFGPDGKLYFNMGNESKHLFRPVRRDVPLHGIVEGVEMKPVVDLDGKEVNNLGRPYRMGMVFRCNPDGSDVETLAWNFRNNYEVAVDSFGTLWQSDNDDDGNRGVRINYVMEFGNYGYAEELTGASWSAGWQQARERGAAEEQKVFYEWHQYDPGVVPNLLHTGAGSPTGIAVYEGRLLPQVFRNQMIHCDAGPRVVRTYPVQPEGAGYMAGVSNLLTTPDTWFRPSDVCVAPDGSLLVADWNDAGVGGHYMADQKLQEMTGRIYRIAPRGSNWHVPKSNLNSPAGCVEALQSPNLALRYLAWTRLHEMGGSAEKSLVELWQGHEPRMRARALHLLARVPGRADHYVQAAILDPDADLRITGLRIARELKLDVLPLIRKLSHDVSPQVRRECALALRHNSASEAAALWAILASEYQTGDRWQLEALGIGADGQWDAFLDAWLSQAPVGWDTAAGHDLLWRSRGRTTPALLLKLLNRADLSPQERERYFRALDFCPDAEAQAALIQLLTQASSQRTELVEAGLGRLKRIDLDTQPAVKRALLAAVDRARGTPQFVELVGKFKVPGRESELLAMAAREPGGESGIEAMRLVLESRNEGAVRGALAGVEALKIAEALGNSRRQEMVPLLEPILLDPHRDRALRLQALRALAKVQQGALALLQLAETMKLPDDLRLAAGYELNGVHWDDLRARAAKVLPLAKSSDAQLLPPISELLKRQGDVDRGNKVFHSDRVGCLKCHQVNGEGIDFGPNLSEIGAKLGKDALYESVLDPSAGIAFGYEAWQIQFRNGDEAFGLIVSETESEISVKAVGGVLTRYNKNEITSRQKQKISIMPTNLTQAMSDQEFVDLIEYLASLKKAAR